MYTQWESFMNILHIPTSARIASLQSKSQPGNKMSARRYL